MSIRLAIHESRGSFSDRWIDYCTERNLDYEVVNCFDSRIMERLRAADGLLWHWVYYDPKCRLTARQIILSAEQMGISVFPNTSTCWHYDDKIGQKYLLEAIDAPIVPTYIFLDRDAALDWISTVTFPKVFKLRSGSGSQTVVLIRNAAEAIKYCRRAFGSGFSGTPTYFSDAKTKIRKTANFGLFLKKLRRMQNELNDIAEKRNLLPRQKGYVYFQDFLPDNEFDTRVTIIGNRAFGFRRANRPNDFRASGSGAIIYAPDGIDMRCVQIAFKVAKKLKTQSLAFDFVYDRDRTPKIVELSYCFQSQAVYDCPGHWDDKLDWHVGHLWPQDAILVDFLESLRHKASST